MEGKVGFWHNTAATSNAQTNTLESIIMLFMITLSQISQTKRRVARFKQVGYFCRTELSPDFLSTAEKLGVILINTIYFFIFAAGFLVLVFSRRNSGDFHTQKKKNTKKMNILKLESSLRTGDT